MLPAGFCLGWAGGCPRPGPVLLLDPPPPQQTLLLCLIKALAPLWEHRELENFFSYQNISSISFFHRKGKNHPQHFHVLKRAKQEQPLSHAHPQVPFADFPVERFTLSDVCI